MEITESWLAQIGGWQAIKAARSLVGAGHAVVSQHEGGLIRGTAGAGKMKFACGLRIRSRSDVDNLCTCPMARRSGMMCEHSLAVALATLQAVKTAAPKPEPKVEVAPPAPPAEKTIAGQYGVFLPERMREPCTVLVRHEPTGTETSRLAAWLAGQGISKPQTVPLSLRGAALEAFMAAAGGHPRIFTGKPTPAATPTQIAAEPVRLPLTVEAVNSSEIRLQVPTGAAEPLWAGWWFCAQTAVLFRVPPVAGLEPFWQELAAGQGKPVSRPIRWLVAERDKLDAACQIELKGEVLAGFHLAPVPCEFEVHLEGSLQALDARLNARFGDLSWPILPAGTVSTSKSIDFPLQDERNAACFYVPDSSGEQRLIVTLQKLGFSYSNGAWQLRGGESVLRFYASSLPKLREQARVIEGDRWRTVTRTTQRIVPKMIEHGGQPAGRGGDWLSMEFAYEAPDGFRLPRNEVLRLIRSGQRSVTGRNGLKYVLDADSVEEMEETLKDVPIQLTPEGARIQASHANYLRGDFESVVKLPDAEVIRAKLGPLAATLRDYQIEGVRWLAARAELGRGGILADDMGLGKTLQSIALVLCRPFPDLPTLVVCPKSLLGNWEAELTRFAPQLKVLRIDGSGREKHFSAIAAQDVILTSYPLISRDLDSYAPVKLGLVLLDEASFIKNPDTEAAKAARRLQAGARFALTGTPLENGVRDLWSIMQFALPNYLGSRENFKERFEQPISGHLDSESGQKAATRLRRLVQPYFLRRTKRQVLRELPEKIEQVLWCDPTPIQAEVYRRILEEGREEIKAARRRSGANGSRMTMLTVLLRLRQVCCDFRLTKVADEAVKGLEAAEISGKWAAMEERLDSILESGGKALIFSQFVEFLHLIRDRLQARRISFCYLDGVTKDRAEQVAAFQTDPSRTVFLISLKAGGYGLNLTAADHVLLADPWWNPAVEAQAIDRAHRLGQQRVVNAYRLVVRGTVEERILSLQEKKRGLVQATLEEGDLSATGLTDDEIAGLLED